MIAIIDYGMGNLHSVNKAFLHIGAQAVVTSDPQVIKNAEKIVLPGVGAFGDCMKNLEEANLIELLQGEVKKGKPFMGICMGLQVLFEGSEEDPGVEGLGIFSGVVKKIQAPGLKVPHMGWNDIEMAAPSPLYQQLEAKPFVYFVHSYHAVPTDKTVITATTQYGEKLTASVGRDNVQAVQFHPEKSSSLGLALLRNFKEWNP